MICYCSYLLMVLWRNFWKYEEYGVEYNHTFNPTKFPYLIFWVTRSDMVNKGHCALWKTHSPRAHWDASGTHVNINGVRKVSISGPIRDLSCNTSAILSLLRHLNTWERVQPFNSLCLKLYGCELWVLRKKDVLKLYCEWRKCARLTVDVESNA